MSDITDNQQFYTNAACCVSFTKQDCSLDALISLDLDWL